MIEVAISFVIIFLNFSNDAHYFVHGISARGNSPRTEMINETIIDLYLAS